MNIIIYLVTKCKKLSVSLPNGQLTASVIWISHHKIGACAERFAGCKEYFADGIYSTFQLFARV